MNQIGWDELTAEETKVLQYIADGLTSRLIAKRLNWEMSVRQVEILIHNLMTKTNSLNRCNLVARAMRHGVIK